MVGLDVFKDFNFGDVEELVDCGGAIAVLAFLPIGFLRCKMGLKDFVVVVFAAVLDGGDRPSLSMP